MSTPEATTLAIDESGVSHLTEGLFRAWDFFLLRMPSGRARPGVTPRSGPEKGDAAYLELLRLALADAHLVEAIRLASPDLQRTMRKVAEGRAASLKSSQLRRAAFAVLRYDIRMRTRPTPFGLFAGVSSGDFVERPDVGVLPQPGSAHPWWTRTTVDMQWLLALVRELEAEVSRLPSMPVRAHPALVVRGGRIVLDCASTFGASPGERSRASVSLRRTEPVAHALELAEETVRIGELTDRLTERFGRRAVESIRRMLDSLVSQEILISGLRPPLDGTDPLAHVIDVWEGADGDPVMVTALRDVAARIEDYDRVPAGQGSARLDAALDAARRLHTHPTPLHVDSHVEATSGLPSAVAREVERAVELMWRMSTPKLGLFALREYHAKFLERYGTDRLVPLLDLLDGNVGMGPPTGYTWPNSEAVDDVEQPLDRDRDRVLYRLLVGTLRANEREVVLDDDTARSLFRGEPGAAEVPNSCEVTVQVVASSLQKLAEGEFLVALAPSPGSHHAGSTMKRFSGALGVHENALRTSSSGLPTHVRGALTANIAFLPRSGKAANLLHTPPDTGRRISLGLADSDRASELRLTDLAVAATRDRLCVVHVPSGREVTPVLANMVSATAQAPNAARLLWEIGLEGQRLWEPWKWGALADSPFVPRVRYGRFVLAPAVWRLDELRAAADWKAGLARWRRRYAVPRHVQAVSNDQRLRVDLDQPWHVELLREESRKDEGLVVSELPGEQQGWLDGDVAGHLTEVVVPLQRRRNPALREPTPAYSEPDRVRHGLGGEWIFLKLYATAGTQDDLLRQRVPDLVTTAREHGADRWFFLRYTDPDGHHLRLRLHGNPAVLWGSVAGAVGQVLDHWQQAGLIRAHRVDQYDPELERYGGAGLSDEVERVFAADSAAALDMLELASDPACPYDLDTFASVSVAALAHAFGPPSGEPASSAAEAWLSRTGSRRDLPRRFRVDAARLAALINPEAGWPGLRGDVFGEKVLSALRDRDERVAEVRRVMDALRGRQECNADNGRFIGSLLHMTCNRLIGGDSARERDVVAVARGAVQDSANRRRYCG